MNAKISDAGNVLGPIADEILFENEHLRVWSFRLEPLGHQPLHQHELPYLIVPLSTGEAEMRWEDGTTRKLVDQLGDVKWRGDPGKPHELFNRSNSEMRAVLVELKTGKA